MPIFKVVPSNTAESDLAEIVDYLADRFSFEIASRYYLGIKKKIVSLERMPQRCPLVYDEEFRSKGYHWLSYNNYTIFFTIHNNKNIVVIRRVMYSGRDYTTLL